MIFEHFVGLLGLAVVLFASTNVDDVFVLLGFFSDRKFRARQVVIGQYLGFAALYGVSVLASLISLVVPTAYVGLLGFAPIFLGVAPIFLGVKKLWEMCASQGAVYDAEVREQASTGHANIVAVALVTIANGGDNISTYTPIFATRAVYEVAVIGLVFAAMTAAWLGAAHYLTNHHTLGEPIRRYGHKVVPFILVALGIFILNEAGTIQFWSSFLGW